MLDIMVDLESMGLQPDSAIVGVGLVEFDLSKGLIGNSFFRAINLGDSVRRGCSIDAGTVAWWLSQTKEAQNAIMWNTGSLSHTLKEIADFMHTCGPAKEIRVWGNDPAFDNAMLAHSYWLCEMEQPWSFWNNRCVRTLRALYKHVEKDEFVGEKHNALDDAMAQVQHLIKIRNSVKKK